MQDASLRIGRLGVADVPAMQAVNRLFHDAFGDDAYEGPPASDGHLRRLLGDERFIALAAYRDDFLAGALTAYELVKYEADRTEIYIYDLAVGEPHRRRGVATALIERLRELGRERGAWVIFVQADPPDAPAVALYDGLGTREDVLHFDISVSDR